MVTHFPALQATSFIPECASGSDEKRRHSLPWAGTPAKSQNLSDICRWPLLEGALVHPDLGPRWVDRLGHRVAVGPQDSGPRVGQEVLGHAWCPSPPGLALGPRLVGSWSTQPPTVESQAQPVVSAGLLGPPATCPLPASHGSWGRNICLTFSR